MRNAARLVGLATVSLGLCAPSARAQTLEESCPGLADDLGGLIGYVVDSDSETIMPAATVTATWADGEATADSGFDGVYRLCGVPVGVQLVLQARFATFAGEAMQHEMAENFERLDFGVSLLAAAATAAESEDRILISLPDGRCPETLQFPNHLLCREGWHLERCEYVDRGRIVARRTGSGTDAKELVEQFVTEAQRQGANAVLDLRGDMRQDADQRTGSAGAGNLLLVGLEGLAIELVDPTCRG